MRSKRSVFIKRSANDSNSSLKQQFSYFVNRSKFLNNNSYGEILFVELGRKPTYSPYVTTSAKTDLQVIWSLLTRYWNLSLPHVILSTVGEFIGHDSQWKNATKHSWIFTKGSSPLNNFDDACIIAVVQANSFQGSDCLYTETSENTEGMFPAVYSPRIYDQSEKPLDSHHSHFIFVEGTTEEVDEFRINLLEYLGSTPIDFDSTSTRFVEIPVVALATSDSLEEVLHVAKCAELNHSVLINAQAENIFRLIVRIKQNSRNVRHRDDSSRDSNKTKNEIAAGLSSLLNLYEQDVGRVTVEKFFKNIENKPVGVFPTIECNSMEYSVIKTVMKSPRHTMQTTIRLSLMWNYIDIIKECFSLKTIVHDSNFLPSCLSMALLLDRTEFLEILFDLGVNIYSTLTVKMLWTMYQQGVMMSKNESSMSYFVRSLVRQRKTERKYLLREIGRVVTHLTNQECTNIYSDNDYVFTLREVDRYSSDFNEVGTMDTSVNASLPERDIFFWCILMGKDDLAKVIWKHGNEYIASALCASTIYRMASNQLKDTAKHSILTEKLESYSKSWEEVAIKVLRQSYKVSEEATLSQLMAKLPQLGGCSCLTLAHTGIREQFMSQGPVQTTLDLLWKGNIANDTSVFKILLGICFPFLIPILGVVKVKKEFSFFSNQAFYSKFSDAAAQTEFRQSVANVWDPAFLTFEPPKNIQEDVDINTSLSTAFRKMYDFTNSPRITFFTHTGSLIIAIVLMTCSLLLLDRKLVFGIHLYWLFWYMLGNLFDECRQLMATKGNKFSSKLKRYLSDGWNICDIIMLLTYYTGVALILAFDHPDEGLWIAQRTMICVSLICLFLRALQTYYVSKLLGPILFMIRQMLSDLLVFVAILLMVFFAYGIVKYSVEIRYPGIESTSNFSRSITAELLVNHILRIPFWQIFGEELTSAAEHSENTYEMLSGMCTGLYVLFTTILMINLLIAMFSYTFDNIQEQSYIVWSYNRYDIIHEFADRPLLASPLILITHFYRLITSFSQSTHLKSPFKRITSPQEIELSRDFESEVLEEMIQDESESVHSDEILQNLIKRQEMFELKLSQLTNKMEESNQTTINY